MIASAPPTVSYVLFAGCLLCILAFIVVGKIEKRKKR